MVALLYERVNHHCLLWFHDGFIVVAQVGERAFVAARAFKHAHALPVPQQGFVEIVDGAGILRQESLQKGMSVVGCDLLAN